MLWDAVVIDWTSVGTGVAIRAVVVSTKEVSEVGGTVEEVERGES